MQAWNIVDDESEDCGHGERISRDGDNVCELNVQLFPVVRNPTALVETGVNTIEADDVASAEDAVRKETNHTGNSMFGEDVECIVDTDPKFN